MRWLFVPWILAGIVSFATGQDSADTRVTRANLRATLVNLPVPGKSPELFRAPSPLELDRFSRLVRRLAAGNDDDAGNRADRFDYTFQRFQETESGDVILLLHERPLPGDPGFRGQGFYAFRVNAQHRLVIQAPHPRFDLYTRVEAIDAFLEVEAAALFVAGTHRHNATTLSPCTNGQYRISDVAHWHLNFFQAAHETLVRSQPDLITVQLHGYANPIDEHFILSEGFAADPPANRFIRRLEWYLENQEGYQADVYPTEDTRLGGTWNTQGRYSNGERVDPCTTAATSSTGRFVHVEQALEVRQDPAGFLRALRATAREFWP